MVNLPRVVADASWDIGPAPVAAAEGETVTHLARAGESIDVIPVVEETLSVAKRRRPAGRVVVSTRTETVDAAAAVDLKRYWIEVTLVPVGRVVDEAPAARSEGNTTVIPVVEERLVTVKQLVLIEELRIRHVLEGRSVRRPATLRRQRAVVERLDPDGGTSPDGTVPIERTAPGATGGRHGFVG